MPNAYVSGVGFYVPPRVVANDELAREFGVDTTDPWILQRTGIEERRFAEDGVATSDLALLASQKALAHAGLAATDLDLILFATLSPDCVFPGASVYLQRKLGVAGGDSPKFVAAMDIRNQCSGFVYGLATATAMVRGMGMRHVLVVGAEKHSAALDLSTRGRSVCTLFGDGAGAVVVSATEDDRGVRGCWLGADGRYSEALTQKIWDISKRPFVPLDQQGVGQVQPEMLWARMDGQVVFKHAVERLTRVVMEACWTQRLTANDIDLFVFHQANLRVNQRIAEKLGVPPDRLAHNVMRYGNTTAATIPILLAECVESGRLKPGMKVLIAAFGSGFTWGAAIVDW